MDAAAAWFYLDGGNSVGPVPASQIQDLVTQGRLAGSVLVAQRGWTGWCPAAEIFPELSPNGTHGTEASLPPPPPVGSPRQNMLDPWRKRIQDLAGTEALESFSLREMFSDVFKRRTPEELDDYFVVGTYRTTPDIREVETGWPKPWLFMRVLLFVGVVYIAFSWAMQQFQNENCCSASS